MKNKIISTRLFFIVLLCLSLAFVGCQVKSQNLQLGVFASPETCVKCHASDSEYHLKGAQLGYDHSGHKNGYEMKAQNSYYANGAGCQQCHTNEGFIQYASTGSVDKDGFIEYPSQPGCFTCHDPHKTADFSLRKTDAPPLADGTAINFGAGNLCANCHRARTAATTVVATPANKVSSRLGPHYGPEADVLAGVNAYHYTGKAYSSSPHKEAVKDTCVSCHMFLPQERYSSSPELGGHSFSMEGEVHETETVNIKACLQCHSKMGQVKGQPYFDKKADDDYDQDGTVEPVQQEVLGLLELFVNSKGTGALQKLALPLIKADGNFNTTSDVTTERPADELGALYNYRMMLGDRSLGIHNTIYTIQILYDSLEALDPKFDASKRPL